MNLLEGAKAFLEIGLLVEERKKDALNEACKVIEDEAKRVIGTYDYGWAELADSTKNEREYLGFPENEPLLRSGQLRASIEHNVSGDSGHVGSNDDVAVYQELGTSRGIPPRSFLAGAAIHKGPDVARTIGSEIMTAFKTGAGRAGAPRIPYGPSNSPSRIGPGSIPRASLSKP